MPSGVYKRTKPIWNKGLTKETDERVKKHGEKISKANKGRIFSEEHKKKIGNKHRNKIVSKETRKKISESRLKRKQELGYTHSPETRKKISESKKGKNNPMYGKHHTKETKKKISDITIKAWKNPEIKIKISGKNNYRWNPNRAEVYAPYGENFYNKNIRNRKWNLQNGRDMLTGTKLNPDKQSAYHHIDYHKSNDESDNHCFLSINNHMRITGYQKNPIKLERYKKILQENTLALKNGEIPKYWSQINKELFKQEKLKQLDLSSYII